MAIGGFTAQGVAQGIQTSQRNRIAREELGMRRQALEQDQKRLEAAEAAEVSKKAREGLLAFVEEARKLKADASVSSEEFFKSPAGQAIASYGKNEAQALGQIGGMAPELVDMMFMSIQEMPTKSEAATRDALGEAAGEVEATRLIIDRLGEDRARELGILPETPAFEALQKIEAARAVAAETGVSEREALIGQGVLSRPPQKPAATVATFMMPDKSIVPVDMRDEAAVQQAINNGGVRVGLSVQSPTLGGVASLTEVSPENIEAARVNLEDTSQRLNAVQSAAKAFAETPEAGGLLAPIIENVGGVLQQFEIGKRILNQAGVDPAEVTAVRSQGRAVVSQMLETITGEESGRFTDTERQLARDTLRALEPQSSPEQIAAAFETVQNIMKPALMRDATKLLNASGADLGTPEGRQSFFDVLVSNGLTQDQAEDLLLDMMRNKNLVVSE